MSEKQDEWLKEQMASNLPFQLRQLERRRPENWSPAERTEYQRVVSLLKVKSDQPEWAQALYRMADGSRSPGAARALRGTPNSVLREKVIEQVVLYTLAEPTYEVPERPPPRTADGKLPPRWPSFAMPLALGESDDYLTREVLIRALRFHPKKREELGIDLSFRRGAAESLGTVDHDDCRRALLGVLLDSRDNPAVRQACRDVLRSRPFQAELLAPYAWLRDTPERKALRRLACEEVGRVRAWVTPLSRFRQVREDLLVLLKEAVSPERAEPPPAIPRPTSQQRAPRKAPPTSPTKATPVAPAPPASGRQQPGERPKTGSDEGDSQEPIPKMGYCQNCMRQLNEEGLLTPEQLEEQEPVPPRECVRCSFLKSPG